MKTKSSISVSIYGNVKELCDPMSEIYPKPKLIVCIDVFRIIRSLRKEGIIPKNMPKSINVESVRNLEFLILKENKTIKVEDSETEFPTISKEALEDLLLLRIYAKGTLAVSY